MFAAREWARLHNELLKTLKRFYTGNDEVGIIGYTRTWRAQPLLVGLGNTLRWCYNTVRMINKRLWMCLYVSTKENAVQTMIDETAKYACKCDINV